MRAGSTHFCPYNRPAIVVKDGQSSLSAHELRSWNHFIMGPYADRRHAPTLNDFTARPAPSELLNQTRPPLKRAHCLPIRLQGQGTNAAVLVDGSTLT